MHALLVIGMYIFFSTFLSMQLSTDPTSSERNHMNWDDYALVSICIRASWAYTQTQTKFPHRRIRELRTLTSIVLTYTIIYIRKGETVFNTRVMAWHQQVFGRTDSARVAHFACPQYTFCWLLGCWPAEHMGCAVNACTVKLARMRIVSFRLRNMLNAWRMLEYPNVVVVVHPSFSCAPATSWKLRTRTVRRCLSCMNISNMIYLAMPLPWSESTHRRSSRSDFHKFRSVLVLMFLRQSLPVFVCCVGCPSRARKVLRC